MSGVRRVEVAHAVDVDPVMIVVESPRTIRHATGTDGTDRDLRSLDQQGLVRMLTRWVHHHLCPATLSWTTVSVCEPLTMIRAGEEVCLFTVLPVQ